MRPMAFFCHFTAFQAHFTCLQSETSPFGQCCRPSCANRISLGIGLCRSYATANSSLSEPARQRCARSANGSWTWSCCLPVLLASNDGDGSPCAGYVLENPPEPVAPPSPSIDKPNPPRHPYSCCRQGTARKHCCRARPLPSQHSFESACASHIHRDVVLVSVKRLAVLLGPACVHIFSSRLFRCLGTFTMLACTICPFIAMKPLARR